MCVNLRAKSRAEYTAEIDRTFKGVYRHLSVVGQ